MAGWRRAVELAMTDEGIETLTALSRSRTEPARRVSRAAMLLRQLPCRARRRVQIVDGERQPNLPPQSGATESTQTAQEGQTPELYWPPKSTSRHAN
jgi:hypothetical protein